MQCISLADQLSFMPEPIFLLAQLKAHRWLTRLNSLPTFTRSPHLAPPNNKPDPVYAQPDCRFKNQLCSIANINATFATTRSTS
jgi:hypothetical protein